MEITGSQAHSVLTPLHVCTKPEHYVQHLNLPLNYENAFDIDTLSLINLFLQKNHMAYHQVPQYLPHYCQVAKHCHLVPFVIMYQIVDRSCPILFI